MKKIQKKNTKNTLIGFIVLGCSVLICLLFLSIYMRENSSVSNIKANDLIKSPLLVQGQFQGLDKDMAEVCYNAGFCKVEILNEQRKEVLGSAILGLDLNGEYNFKQKVDFNSKDNKKGYVAFSAYSSRSETVKPIIKKFLEIPVRFK
jgi:hypothetical protein